MPVALLLPGFSPMPLTSQTVTEDIRRRAARVRLLALDCDGVLTDGGVYVDDEGRESRRFNVNDGLGLKRIMDAGIHVAIISSGDSTAVVHRARKLGITEVYIGVDDKFLMLTQLCTQAMLELSQVAYMGDDLPDIPILKKVGLSCAPANAVEAVRGYVHLVTIRGGGAGAVRELCDLLFEAKS